MIDQLEGLNIKDFVIPEPKKSVEFHFDPVRDISDETFGKMTEALRREAISMGSNDSLPPMVIKMAADMRTIAGEDQSRIPQIDQTGWNLIDNTYSKLSLTNDSQIKLGMLRSVHIFDPERAKDDKYKIEKEQLDIIQDSLEDLDTQEYINILSSIKIIDPDRAISIPDNRWNDIKNMYDNFNETIFLYPAEKTRERNDILGLMINAKLIDSKKFNDLFPKDNLPWVEMKNELGKVLNDNNGFEMIHYSYYAKQLLYLSADEIDVTNSGVEFKMVDPKQDIAITSSMPEARKF